MNRKQLAFLLVALLFIGGAGLVLIKRHREAWSQREARVGDKVLPGFPFNDITEIHISGPSDFHVVRKDGVWKVPERFDYPADYAHIKDSLLKLRDIKVVQSEVIGPSQLGRVDLAPPGTKNGGGMLVEFKDQHGKLLDSLLLGKRHLRPTDSDAPFTLKSVFDGRYILLPSDPANVLLISDDLPAMGPETGAWLSRDFFRIENIKSISHVAPDPANSWRIARDTVLAKWKLADARPGETVDRIAAGTASEILYFPEFLDVLSPRDPAKAGADFPRAHIVTVKTFDGLTYTICVSEKLPDGNRKLTVAVAADLPANRPAGQNETAEDRKSLDAQFQSDTEKLRNQVAKEQFLSHWVYLVESRTVDPYTRDRSEMLQKDAIPDRADDKNVSLAPEPRGLSLSQ